MYSDCCGECIKKDAQIASLKDRIKRVEGVLEGYAQCSDGCSCGDGWSHEPAIEALSICREVSNVDKD